jgi:ADP-ribose pyrophosphatase YjhB (NUDIX family)
MKDNNFASVGAIVLRGNEVLLVRHTYGSAAGKLLNPGGMLKEGELPYDAVKREVMEETGITVEPAGLIAVRCSATNWYMAFLCNHVAGEPKTDNAENSEAIFLDCSEVLEHPEVTDTAKALLQIALDGKELPMQDARKGRVMFSTGDIV